MQTRKVLLKGIFEATEVKTPTTFIILDEMLSAEEPELSAEEQDQLLSLKEDGSGIELAGNLKETEVAAQLEKRARERREEERRRDKLFNIALARTPSEAANDVETLRAELAAREEATEAKARGGEETSRGVAETAQKDKLDQPPRGACCSVL